TAQPKPAPSADPVVPDPTPVNTQGPDPVQTTKAPVAQPTVQPKPMTVRNPAITQEAVVTAKASQTPTYTTTSSSGPSDNPNGMRAPDDSSAVPTNVSQKVLIGIAAVGCLGARSLASVAFWRRRRKKLLA